MTGSAADDETQMDVMLVAAPREMINSRIDAVERAGLEAVSVDLEAFALQRALVDCNRRQFEDGAISKPAVGRVNLSRARPTAHQTAFPISASHMAGSALSPTILPERRSWVALGAQSGVYCGDNRLSRG